MSIFYQPPKLRGFARIVLLFAAWTWTTNCNDVPTAPKETAPSIARIDQPRSLAVSESLNLDAGAYHTCAVKPDQTVVCWGSNGSGESSVPADLSSVIQVGAGGFHSCALKSDGTVRCWGMNHLGQGSVPAGLSSVTSISTGSFHNCALKSDATVTCWGANGDGERNVPLNLTDVTSISAGGAHTCAVKSDGSATCWGRNNFGQTSIPQGLSPIVKITTGAEHTCALQVDRLDCWGRNDYGQGRIVPMDPLSLVQVAAGAWHNCTLTNAGLVRCWGRNDTGQAQAPTLDSFTGVATGTSHSCGAMADGTVTCWGDNAYGQRSVPAGLILTEQPQQITFTSIPRDPGYVGQNYAVTATGGSSGNPVEFASLTPEVCDMNESLTVNLLAVGTCTITANQAGGNGFAAAEQVEQTFRVIDPLPLPVLVPQLTGGDALACALKHDGTVRCWGENAIQPPPGSTFLQISSGGLHTCGLKPDGTVLCWGQNNFGQSDVPQPLSGIVQVTAGYNHTCALRNDGTVTCWGQNTLGQLNIPAGLAGVTQISTSASHTCARKSNATIACWGANGNGQATVPVDTRGDLVLAGGYHTCAIFNGNANCWGSNANGQSSFAAVKGTSAIYSLGYYFTCRLFDGVVNCFGDNSRGQTTIPPLRDSVRGIAAGGYHACAFDNEGVITCWGSTGAPVPTGLNMYDFQPQTITFTSSPPNPANVGATYSPSASGGGSGNPVLFSSLTQDICTVENGTVSLVAIGTCSIAANQTGGNGFITAPEQTQTFEVLPNLQRVESTNAGNIHTCNLDSSGVITCWGPNGDSRITVPSMLTDAVQLTAGPGSNYSCALRSNATVVCWGANGFGEAVPPATLPPVKQVSAGGKMTCALKFDGTVTCWGYDTDGQLNPPHGMTALYVSAGGDALGCAIKTDRTVACWGYANDGRTTVPSGLANVTQLSAGGQFACALSVSGTVSCWGPNGAGQINVPSGLSNVRQVSAGGAHVCVIKDDRTVTCWGLNTDGQSTPPAGLANVEEVSAGARHTCARRIDKKIICWGFDDFNQATVPTALAPSLAGQTIIFSSTPPSPAVVGTNYNVSANGGASGNPVVFTSSTPSICSVNGSVVSLDALGTCIVAANQAGSLDYSPAPEATQSFVVEKTTQLITFTNQPPDPAILGASYTPTATASSGLPVTFTASGSCTLSGSSVQFESIGQCTVTPHATGNATYLPAEGPSVQFQVIYNFMGFLPSVSNAPVVNIEKAGVIVRLRFTLAGDRGLNVLASGSPASGEITGSCNTTEAPPTTAPSVAASPLKYDPATGEYLYSWQTEGGWVGQCRQFVMTLEDGTVHRANFLFQAPDPTVLLTVSPSEVNVGVATTLTFNLSVASLTTVTSVSGLPCTLPAPNGSASYQGSCNYTNTWTTAGKAYYAAAATVAGRTDSFGSNIIVVTVTKKTVPPLNLVTAAAGNGFACGLTTAGAAYCWGTNWNGLGNGVDFESKTPVPVSGGLVFSSIAVGGQHACGVSSSGEAYCWGNNEMGQLGNGTRTPSTIPVRVTGGHTFASLSAGLNMSTCGVTTSGRGYCWGYGETGQLGNGSLASTSVPTLISGNLTFASIDVSAFHACGLTTSGSALCWGSNASAQLGNAGAGTQPLPVLVSGGFNFVSITTGTAHSCGTVKSGAAYCWGGNTSGQLGIGTTSRWVAQPTLVQGGHSFAFLQAGEMGNCGVTKTGTYCWGANFKGQLGNGSSLDKLSPTLVSGGYTFMSVYPGTRSACAVTKTGAGYCWGDNSAGQLGNGTLSTSFIPVAISPP